MRTSLDEALGMKYPCLYPLPDGSRCCECDACQNPDYVPATTSGLLSSSNLEGGSRWL